MLNLLFTTLFLCSLQILNRFMQFVIRNYVFWISGIPLVVGSTMFLFCLFNIINIS